MRKADVYNALSFLFGRARPIPGPMRSAVTPRVGRVDGYQRSFHDVLAMQAAENKRLRRQWRNLKDRL